MGKGLVYFIKLETGKRGFAARPGIANRAENGKPPGGCAPKGRCGCGAGGVVTGQRGVVGQSFQVPVVPCSAYESGTGGALDLGSAATTSKAETSVSSFQPPLFYR